MVTKRKKKGKERLLLHSNGTYVPIKDLSKVCLKQSDALMAEWPPHLILYSLDKSHANAKPCRFMLV